MSHISKTGKKYRIQYW